MENKKTEKMTKAEMQERIAELEQKCDELEKNAAAGTEKNTDESAVGKLQAENSVLKECLRTSCENHCPHKRNENACKNCSIFEKTKTFMKVTEK